MKNFIIFLSACVILGCSNSFLPSGPLEAHQMVAKTTADVIVASDRKALSAALGGIVQTSHWKIVLKDWQLDLESSEIGPGGVKLELSGQINHEGEKVTMSIFSVSNIEEPVDFITAMLGDLGTSDSTEIIKGVKVDVSDQPGAILLVGRRGVSGQEFATVDLITGKNHVGYTVMCGGKAERIESFGPFCAGVIKSFEFK